MLISPFYHALSMAYQAEMDDLRSDSEGNDVLRQRLSEKRKEMAFLCQMLETSPEMVAVVFNQAFQFLLPSVMDELVTRESDELPDWSSLSDVVALHAWAHPLADSVLKQPMGEWFMTVAAGLEYLYAKPGKALATDAEDDDADEERDDDEADNDFDDRDDGESDARSRDEAGEDWMEEQGFDRKGH